MKLLNGAILVAIGFLIGLLSTQLYSSVQYPLGAAPERISPQDRISESNIQVLPDKVVLNLEGAKWATFADTNSMDPIFDKGANAIQIEPKSVNDIEVGDIVTYKRGDRLIIHRVIEKNIDAEGWYFIVKGDNNATPDAGKIRFDDITRVVVAIVY